jgi:hypothetical protein
MPPTSAGSSTSPVTTGSLDGEGKGTDECHRSDSIAKVVPTDTVDDMVSDISGMGEWSPGCTRRTWGDVDSARMGAWLTGTNVHPARPAAPLDVGHVLP